MKDNADFLRKLDAIKSVPDNTYLASFDVKPLCKSILSSEAKNAMKELFEK